MRKRKFRWLKWLNILLFIYLLGGIAFYYFQDRLLFHPRQVARDQPYNFPFPNREINISFDSASNINIIQFTVPEPRGVVLYLHGNKNNISWYANYATNFTSRGYEVWMLDYPRFGKSTGILSEQRLHDYSEQIYGLARARFAADSIIIYGKSLGTGLAAWLASKRTCKRLILECPYYSMTSLVAHYLPIYPVTTLMRFRMPTYSYLELVNAPITIFHGTNDVLIPYSNAERLKEVMQAKDEFVPIPDAGHNNLNDSKVFQRKLDSLLQH